MNDFPAVTVITATYNSSKTLKFTIKSVLNQDFKDFEYYIVGDCCTDDTEKVVNLYKDQRIKWINLNENTGTQAVPNNEGLKRAKGRFIAYINHDDLWFPWHLSNLKRFIEEEKVDLVHSLCARIGPEVTEWPVGPPYNEYNGHNCPPSTWFHKKEVIKDCGFWPETSLYTKLPASLLFFGQVEKFNKNILYSSKLSVIKFDSWIWKHYAKNKNIPQKEYCEKILLDPNRLEKKILIDLATELGRQTRKPKEKPTISQAYRIFYFAIRRYLFDFIKNTYGENNWPLSLIIQRRWLKGHKQDRSRRGLN